MKTLNRILLSENTKAIEKATESANERAGKLNEISNVFECESEIEFNSRTANIDSLVRSLMLSRPEIKKLSQTVQIDSIVTPPEILEAKQKIIALIKKHDDLFENISHDGKQWIADIDKLEAFTESQRIFAEGEMQIQKLEGAKNLCEFLNKHKFGFSFHEKGMYHNFMIEWSLQTNCWEPSIHWIKS